MFLSDSSSYCATLYDGLKSCPQDQHVHVLCDTDYIAHLIGRAEPELAGGYAILDIAVGWKSVRVLSRPPVCGGRSGNLS